MLYNSLWLPGDLTGTTGSLRPAQQCVLHITPVKHSGDLVGVISVWVSVWRLNISNRVMWLPETLQRLQLCVCVDQLEPAEGATTKTMMLCEPVVH